jgi:transposase, IS30 family
MGYKQLTKSERYYIEQRKASAPTISLRQLAREMGRSHTTLSRENRRNFDELFGFYSGIRAETLAAERKKSVNLKTRKMPNIPEVASEFVLSSLQERTSPEQICGRLKRIFGLKISHPTLYKHINEDKRNGGKLYLNLRHGKKKYRRKLNKDSACAVINKKRITERPAIAEQKQEPGHWEIDTIFGLDQKSYLLTLTDKATKFEIVRKIPNKEAATVLAEMEKIIAFTLLPFKTITPDNGTEFAYYEQISKVTGAGVFFAHPYRSWERGLNEHQNGLIRDFYPKKTDFREVSDADIAQVEKNLNNRPRKSLGFLTPTEAMLNYVKLGKWCT